MGCSRARSAVSAMCAVASSALRRSCGQNRWCRGRSGMPSASTIRRTSRSCEACWRARAGGMWFAGSRRTMPNGSMRCFTTSSRHASRRQRRLSGGSRANPSVRGGAHGLLSMARTWSPSRRRPFSGSAARRARVASGSACARTEGGKGSARRCGRRPLNTCVVHASTRSRLTTTRTGSRSSSAAASRSTTPR